MKDLLHQETGCIVCLIDFGMAVEIFKKIAPQKDIVSLELRRISDEARGMLTHFGRGGNTRIGDHCSACGDQIFHLTIDEAAQDEFAKGAGPGSPQGASRLKFGLCCGIAPEFQSMKFLFAQKSRF